MKKRLSLFVVVAVLLTGCSKDAESTETSTKSATQNQTAATTSSISEVISSSITTAVTTPVEYDSILDKYKAKFALLKESDTPFLYYCFLEETNDKARVYIQFHGDDIADNVTRIDDFIRLRNSSPWLQKYQSVRLEFCDKNEELIMLRYDTLGMSWFDEEYENAYNGSTEQIPQPNDTAVQENVLYDDNNILVTSKELLDTRTGGKELEIYIENTSQSDYYVRVENVCINDYQVIVSGTWLSLAGKKLNDSIEIYSSELSNNNITEIDKIEFTIRFSNHENDEKFYSDVIVLEY